LTEERISAKDDINTFINANNKQIPKSIIDIIK